MVLAASVVQGKELRSACREDHVPAPDIPESEKIGTIAGYYGFGQFIEDGGYGTAQNVIEDMESMNAEYQEELYDPLQAEASSIYDWLNAVHEIDDGSNTEECNYCGTHHTMAEYEAIRDGKIERLNEIDQEIDEAWCALVDTMRGMVSDSAYESYIDNTED
jgi:hypothetical protein